MWISWPLLACSSMHMYVSPFCPGISKYKCGEGIIPSTLVDHCQMMGEKRPSLPTEWENFAISTAVARLLHYFWCPIPDSILRHRVRSSNMGFHRNEEILFPFQIFISPSTFHPVLVFLMENSIQGIFLSSAVWQSSKIRFCSADLGGPCQNVLESFWKVIILLEIYPPPLLKSSVKSHGGRLKFDTTIFCTWPSCGFFSLCRTPLLGAKRL